MLNFKSLLLSSTVALFLAAGLAPNVMANETAPSSETIEFPYVAATSPVNGDVASSLYQQETSSTLIALTDVNGYKIWETTIAGMRVLPLFDAAGNLFYKSETNVMSMDRSSGATRWTFARANPIDGEHIYYIETYGSDVFVTYGIQPVRYPAMGIVRLDAQSGAMQWDVWVGTSVTLRGVENGQLVTEGPFASGPYYYKL